MSLTINRLGDRGDDGTTDRAAGAAVLRISARRLGASRSSTEKDRRRARFEWSASRAGAVLQPYRAAIGRSRTDDPNAAGRLLLRPAIRADACAKRRTSIWHI